MAKKTKENEIEDIEGITTGKYNEDNEDIPEWEKGLKKESVDTLVALPKMYPQLKPRMDAKYKLRILTLPRRVTTKEYGKGFVMEVIIPDGDINSLFVGESIKIAFAVYRRRNKLKAKDLLDKNFTLQKVQTEKDGETINVFLVTFD